MPSYFLKYDVTMLENMQSYEHESTVVIIKNTLVNCYSFQECDQKINKQDIANSS